MRPGVYKKYAFVEGHLNKIGKNNHIYVSYILTFIKFSFAIFSHTATGKETKQIRIEKQRSK